MPEAKRSIIQRAGTFARFFAQQRARLPSLAGGLQPPEPTAAIVLTGAEPGWTASGLAVAAGEKFKVRASGHAWLAKGLGLVLTPASSIFVRIGGKGPVRRLGTDEWVFEAWTDGEVELLSKALSEFANEDGELLPGKRPAMKPGLGVSVTQCGDPPSSANEPDGWNYLWRIGQARVFSGETDDVEVMLNGSVGILQRTIDQPLTADTQISWEWLIEQLPSELPEDLAFTHDYISIAVEFENGRDLTYMWSAGLDEGHIFRCPLDWWCDWETHWVLRSGADGLGNWHHEKRNIAQDYRAALGEPAPQRIMRVWLIANSVFQRRKAKARFRNIRVG